MTALASGARRTVWTSGRATQALIIGAIVLAAAAVQLLSKTNTDVSWLLTLSERWLAGERPYVEFIEVNPPASILLYMPAVLVSRLSGLSPEAATIALMLGGAVASAALTSGLVTRARLVAPCRGPLNVLAIVMLLTILPTGDFAEREHIAVIAILPLLALISGSIAGWRPALVTAVLAGAGGGIAVAIKPMFALALAGPVFLLIGRRGWRAPFSEPALYAAALLPLAYGVAVPFAFPAFTGDVLHRVLVAYVPLRQPLVAVLLSPVTLTGIGFVFVAMLLTQRGGRTPWISVLLLAALGFAVAFVGQGKGWAYQALPMNTLAALSAVTALLDGRPADRSRGLLCAISLLLAGCGALDFAAHPTMGAAIPGLAEAIVATKPHPTMMALTSDIALGHPLVRDVGGRWVGTFPAEWISSNADQLRALGVSPETDAELQRLSREERATVAGDLRTRQPDVVLVHGARWQAYIDTDPTLRESFAPYRFRGAYGPVGLWTRTEQDGGSGPTDPAK